MSKGFTFTRTDDVLIYTLGLLEELKAEGIVEGGAESLTGSGQERFLKLKAENFSPTAAEMIVAFEVIQEAATEI